MRFSGFSPFTPGTIQLKRLPPKTYPKATAAEIKTQANAQSAKAASDALAARAVGFGESYLPSITKLAPEERPFILASAKSIRANPVEAAKIKFSDADGKKVTSLDQYISDLEKAIGNSFSGVA